MSELPPGGVKADDPPWDAWHPREIADRPLDSPAFDVTHQTWFREPATRVYCVDVFREPHDGDVWICRRDETIRAPYAQIVHRTPDGIPYLAPQIVLLFKAKWARDKDQADFAALLPQLSAAQRSWLRAALAQAHPGQAWIERLDAVQP